jgi:membrane fusion protein, multidrug efflux system
LFKKRWIIRMALTAFVCTVVVTGCAAPEEQPAAEEPEKVTPVQTAQVIVGSLGIESEIAGTAKPSAAVDVYPKLGGDLLELHVKKGDKVRKGAILGEISAAPLQDQLEIDQSNLELEQKRYKSVRVANMNGSATDDQVTQAEIGMEQAMLRLKQTKSSLKDAVLTSPIDGQIVNVNAEAGGYVSPSAPLFSVVTLDPITLSANVSAQQMLLFQEQPEAEVYIPDLELTVQATITYLSPVTNETGFYTIEARADNADQAIKPGMLAKFHLEQQLAKDQLLVPTQAIVEKSDGSYVYVVADGRAVMTAVEVIESQSDLTAVAGEIKEQDAVVTRGQLTLTDGSLVKLVEGAQ